MIFFIVARFVFLFYQFDKSSNLPLIDWFLAMLHGSRLDMSMTGYLLLIPGLLFIATAWFRGKILSWIMSIYTVLMLLIISLLIVADVELYRHWGFRMDATPLLYITNPSEIAGSVNIMAALVQSGIWLVLFVGFIYLYFKFIAPHFAKFQSSNWKTSLAFLFITGTLILPIRGSLGIAPMNVGFVFYHSDNLFANHAAINVTWNVGYALSKLNKNRPVVFFEQEEAQTLFNELFVREGKREMLLKTSKPNVMIMILESFTSKVIEPLGGRKGVAPNFSALAKEGILFSRFYAGGDRTDKAIPAILNGYPSHPTSSVVKFPQKSQELPFLSKSFNDLGYFTHYTYGYDIDYANFRSYLANSEFDKLTVKTDFDPSTYNSKWGVHDHIVFERFLAEASDAQQPFFKVLMSQSSHEPFEVPMETVIEGDDEESMFLNSVFYTDKSLGEFINGAKKTEWWANTVVILVADHGQRHPNNTPSHVPLKFHVPMLWLGGALAVTDTVIDDFSCQMDIAPTILGQVGGDATQYVFGKDIVQQNQPDFAFYDFNNGFGFISDSLEYVYDITGGKLVVRNENTTDESVKRGKAYLQVFMNHFSGNKK